MINTPFFNRALTDSESMKAFVSAFVKAHENDSKAYALVMGKIIRYLRNQAERVQTLQLEIARETATDDMTKAFVDVSNRLAALHTMVDQIKSAIVENNENGFAYIIIRVDYDKVLGTVKNLARLRMLMRDDVEDFNDAEEIKEYLANRLNLFRCYDCGEWEYDAKGCDTWSDDHVCRDCASNNYRYSERYGQYVYSDDARDAYDQNGNRCIIHFEDDDFEYNDDDDEYYHYDYRPEPEILGGYHASKRMQRVIRDDWSNARNRWLGVELECEVKNEDVRREDKARQLNDIINDGEIGKRVFFETDGSLNYGIEIISQPMSLPMHQDVWGWLHNKDAVRYLRSHNTTTCGLHVHVSREPLTREQIAKMVLFVNDRSNEDLIKAVARRYAEGYCRIKEKKLGDAHVSTGDRYEAINITGDKTIEFRIFKGSLKYESVVAAIEFANALTEWTAIDNLAESDLTTDRFMDFVAGSSDCKVLLPYINNRLETA